MTFKEIFQEEGLYTTKSFSKGIAIKIHKNSIDNRLEMAFISYGSPDAINSIELEGIKVYDKMFEKKYRKVLNINQLF